MKKELFKILEDYTLKDVPTEVKEDMIRILNTEGTEFNSFLIQALGMLTDVIEGLEEGNSIVATSVIDVILAIEYSAKNIVVLIEQEKEEMKETLNSEATEFNSFLIRTLSFLTEIIEGLEEGNSIVASSVIDIILAFEFTAKNIVLIAEHEKEDLIILSSEMDSIIINAKSILNAVETIRELQTKKLKELTPEELLIALTT